MKRALLACALFFAAPAWADISYGPSRAGSVEFSGTGTYTWIVSPGVTNVYVHACAPGGGGGSGQVTSGAGGGGGGSGAMATFWPVAVTTGSTVTITIGAGGPGGTVGNSDGTAGGNVTISGTLDVLPVLNGGSAGLPGAGGTGGAGGIGGSSGQGNGGAAATTGGTAVVSSPYYVGGSGGGGGGSTASSGGGGGGPGPWLGQQGSGNGSGGGGARSSIGDGGKGGNGTTPSAGAAPTRGFCGGGGGGGVNNIGGNGGAGFVKFVLRMRAALIAAVSLAFASPVAARVASYGGTLFPVPPPHDVQVVKSIAVRSTYPHNQTAVNVSVGGTFRQYFEASATGTIYAISVCYQNIQASPASTEADGPGAMDGLTATLETSNGGNAPYALNAITKIRQFIFVDRLPMASPPINGGVICSKMLPTVLQPGQGFYIRTYAPPGRVYASQQGFTGNLFEYGNNGLFLVIVSGIAGDGATKTFSGTISQAGTNANANANVVLPLVPRALHMTAGTLVVDDDGAGGWTGDATGTINYTTGAFTLTYGIAPANGVTFAVNGYGRAGTPAPDDTNVALPAGFITALYTGYLPQYMPTLAPVAILGQVDAAAPPQHTLCVVGDSIVSAVGNSAEDKNYIEYMSNSLGIIRVGQGGEAAADFAVNNFRRMNVLSGRCDRVFINFGSNDVSHQDPLATVQANLLSVWSQLAAILPNGFHDITQQMISPYTPSTANNTPITPQWIAERNLLNAWICTQVGVTIGAIVDVNTVLENTPGSCSGTGDGKWKSMTYTSDGRHWSNLAQKTLIPGVFGPTGTSPAPVFAP